MASPTSTSSSDLGQADNHPRTRYGRTLIICSVAQSCPFIRIANIGPLAPHAAGIIARRSGWPPPPLHSNDLHDCGATPSAVDPVWPPERTLRPVITISRSILASRLPTNAPRHHQNARRAVITLHDSALATTTAHVSSNLELPLYLGCDTGVFRVQTGDCRILRYGGARQAGGPDSPQYRA